MIRKIQKILAKAKKTQTRDDKTAINADELSPVEHKIKSIMASIFKINIREINEEASSDNIDQWNSLGHVDLLANLQKEFDIEFTDSQIVEMLDYKAVVKNVTAAIAGKKN